MQEHHAHTSHMTRALPSWLRPAPDSILADTLRQGKPAWIEAVHLLWTVWVFVVPIFSPRGYDLRWAVLTLLTYPLFLALYAGTLLLPRRRVGICALAMIALAMALFRWYPSALTYFVFGCVMLGGACPRPLWQRLLQIALANAALLGLARLLGYPWSVLAWMPVTTLVVGTLVHVERQNQRTAAALKLSHEEVRRLAATAERERIGRDLHDLLGHTLSLVALKADLAGRLVERDPGAARREIDEVARVSREALAQVRHAVTGIRAAGLAAELASAHLLLETDGIVLSYALPDAPLPPELETVLALAVREAVTNVQRHAHARRVRVDVSQERGQVVLSVDDDGRGGDIVPGNGLRGMHERLRLLGGELRVDSRRGQGTQLQACLPLPAALAPGDAPSAG